MEPIANALCRPIAFEFDPSPRDGDCRLESLAMGSSVYPMHVSKKQIRNRDAMQISLNFQAMLHHRIMVRVCNELLIWIHDQNLYP